MARYANGRSALINEVVVSATSEGLIVDRALWPWRELHRADDGGANVILRRKPDTGERITLSDIEAEQVRTAAPHLFTGLALHPERPRLVVGLSALALSIAAVFVFGVPMFAEPLSRYIPRQYAERLATISWQQVDSLGQRCPTTANQSISLIALFGPLHQHARNAGGATVYVINAPFPNAFTLPDNSIVVTGEMIQLAQSPDELAGALAHELGHVEAGHVMENVVRQLGFGMFVDIVFGGSGAGQTMAVFNMLALRYDRDDETEADTIGLRLMDQANYDPAGAARLFRRVETYQAQRERGLRIPEFLSMHPNTGRRAEQAARYARPGRPAALDDTQWQEIRSICQDMPRRSQRIPIPQLMRPAPDPTKPD